MIKKVKAVILTHSETSTGVINDLQTVPIFATIVKHYLLWTA